MFACTCDSVFLCSVLLTRAMPIYDACFVDGDPTRNSELSKPLFSAACCCLFMCSTV